MDNADRNHWRRIREKKSRERKELQDKNENLYRNFRSKSYNEAQREIYRQEWERQKKVIEKLEDEIYIYDCKLRQNSPDRNVHVDRGRSKTPEPTARNDAQAPAERRSRSSSRGRSKTPEPTVWNVAQAPAERRSRSSSRGRSRTRGVDAFNSYPNTIQRISRSASRRRNYQTDEENVCTMQRKLDDLKSENEKLRNQLSQEEKRVIEVSRTLKGYDEELSGLGKQISYLCKELKNKEAALCKLEEHAIPRQRELESGIGENSIAFYRDIRFELDEMKMRSYQNKSQCDEWSREFTLENERLRRENSEMRQKSMPNRQMTTERGYTVGTQNSEVAMLEEELTKLRKRVNDEAEENGKIKRENTTLKLQMKSTQNLREPAYYNSENHKLKEKIEKMKKTYPEELLKIQQNESDMRLKMIELNKRYERLEKESRNHDKEIRALQSNIKAKCLVEERLRNNIAELQNEIQRKTDEKFDDLQRQERVKTKREETERELLRLRRLEEAYYNDQESFKSHQRKVQDLQDDKEKLQRSEKNHQKENKEMLDQLNGEKRYSAELLLKVKDLERQLRKHTYADSAMSEENMRLQEETNQLRSDLQDTQRKAKRLESNLIHVESLKSKHTDLQKIIRELREDKERIKQSEETNQRERGKLQRQLDKEKEYSAELLEKNRSLERLEKLEQGRKQVSEENDRELIRLQRSENAYKNEADDLKIKVAGLQKIVNMLQEKNYQLVEREETERNVREKVQSDLENAQRETKKLQDRIQELERLSALAGERLRDNNAAIAELSAENRPINLGEKFSELYDNQWTDAIEKLEKLMSERDAIQKLLEMIKDIYDVCRNLAKDQLDQIAKAFGFEERKEKLKRLKDLRKSMASENIGDIKKKVDDLCVSKTFSRESSDCSSYISRSVELCWYMCIQDPPVILEFNATRGQVFDDKIYRHFTKSGKTIDYMVWPVMYLHSNGPLLQKGVVQPM